MRFNGGCVTNQRTGGRSVPVEGTLYLAEGTVHSIMNCYLRGSNREYFGVSFRIYLDGSHEMQQGLRKVSVQKKKGNENTPWSEIVNIILI
jgi:hypothetical protein